MVGVGAERGGFCIELDETFSGDLRKAEKTCAIAGKRRCSASEWQIACKEASTGKIPLKNMIGEWEWTGTQANKGVEGPANEFNNRGTQMSKLVCKTYLYTRPHCSSTTILTPMILDPAQGSKSSHHPRTSR